MSKIKIATISVFVIIIFLTTSCTKEEVFQKCQNNCADITIKGQVWDSSNRKGVANIPVKVFWKDAGLCAPCPETLVATSKTDAFGNFYFIVSIDSSLFHGNELHIQAPVPPGYIQNLIDENYCSASLNQYISFFQDIEFIVYQKANLQIQLQRTQNDNFTVFNLDYRFAYTSYGTYWYNGIAPLPITTFNVITGGNVYTKVSWRKFLGVPPLLSLTDSIRCDAGGNNIIILNY